MPKFHIRNDISHNVFRKFQGARGRVLPVAALGDRFVKFIPNRIEMFSSAIKAIKAIKGFVEIDFLIFSGGLRGFDFCGFADVVGVCGLGCDEF